MNYTILQLDSWTFLAVKWLVIIYFCFKIVPTVHHWSHWRDGTRYTVHNHTRLFLHRVSWLMLIVWSTDGWEIKNTKLVDGCPMSSWRACIPWPWLSVHGRWAVQIYKQ